jgi:hypothetical protein
MNNDLKNIDDKINSMNKRIRRMEIDSKIQLAIVILAFVGILSLSDLIRKAKREIKI